METLVIESLSASGDLAPPLAATQPPLSCCSSCSVTLQWEGMCGDSRSHLSHSKERGPMWHAHTRLGEAQLCSSGGSVDALSPLWFLPLCFVSGRKKPQQL